MTSARSATVKRSPIDQVDDILALNARILAMNEKLMQAILRYGHPPRVMIDPINVDELLRNKP